MPFQANHRVLLIILSHVVCVVGFLSQVVYISRVYFAYATVTRVISRHQSDEFFDSPLLIFCSEDWTHVDHSSLPAVVNSSDDLTVRQVLDLTPPPESLVSECRWYDEEGDQQNTTASVCNRIFSIRKSCTQRNVCYHIRQVQGKRQFMARDVTSTYESQYQVFSFLLSDNLTSQVYRLNPLVAAAPPIGSDPPFHLVPYLSRPYGSRIRVRREQKGPIYVSYLRLSFIATRIELLEAAYETACVRRCIYELIEARRRCILDSLAQINLTSASGFIFEKLHLKRVTLHSSLHAAVETIGSRGSGDCVTASQVGEAAESKRREHASSSAAVRCGSKPDACLTFLSRLTRVQVVHLHGKFKQVAWQALKGLFQGDAELTQSLAV